MLLAAGMFGFHSFIEKMSNRNEKCRYKKQFFRRCTSVPVFFQLVGCRQSLRRVNPPVCTDFAVHLVGAPTSAARLYGFRGMLEKGIKDCRSGGSDSVSQRETKANVGNPAGMVVRIPQKRAGRPRPYEGEGIPTFDGSRKRHGK